MTMQPLTLAVIGTGPRGISVLERLAVRLAETPPDRPVRIHAIDDTEIGAGRIWRTGQDDWYTMNTVAGQITMYSGTPDEGPWRPGAGPALDEWSLSRADVLPLGSDDYATRRTYGLYLRDVYRSIEQHLPEGVELISTRTRAKSLAVRPAGGWFVELDRSPYVLAADHVLLATGHPKNLPDPFERRMIDFCARNAYGPHYECGDSAADMDLGERAIPAGSTVAIRGLGLSFYDVMLSLTLGRGGTFKTNGDRMTYIPSGREPYIVAGSRSGLPIPARGVNQKRPDHTHKARHLTKQAVAAARVRRRETTGNDQLSFTEDVWPLLIREVDQVYQDTHRAQGGVGTLPELDLHKLARPFADKTFSSPGHFRTHLLQTMRADLDDAGLGNARGPLKAALDVLRDIRNVVREAVDYNGLLPASHEEDFNRQFLPVNSLLSAGPPAERVEQLYALIEAGQVDVIGPATEFTEDDAKGLFKISSPQVRGAVKWAAALIDARIPTPDLHRDTSELTVSLISTGIVSEFFRTGPGTAPPVPTGGLNVTHAPFHVIGADGEVHADLYALGIPTEHTRWFTQVGSGKPGLNTLFKQDADAIARAMLAALDDDTDAFVARSATMMGSIR
ncbi:FAD/NAD(P)-binding protein [Streptomyces gardneri]|uniref:FAD/NAD(P)-binding protein n=1 Tax=Streptomyces gardneri TaxID=66892 RepID=UPI0036791F0C